MVLSSDRRFNQQQLVVNNILMPSVGKPSRSLNKNLILPSRKPFSYAQISLSSVASQSIAIKMSNTSTLCGSLTRMNAKPINDTQFENDKYIANVKIDSKDDVESIQDSKGSSLLRINNKINEILGDYQDYGNSSQYIKPKGLSKKPKGLDEQINVNLQKKDKNKHQSIQQQQSNKKGIYEKKKRMSLCDRDRCLTDITDTYLNSKDYLVQKEYTFFEKENNKTEQLLESYDSVKRSYSILDIDLIQLQESAKMNQHMLQSLQKVYLREQQVNLYLGQEIRRPKIFKKLNSSLSRQALSRKNSISSQSQRQRLVKALNKQIVLDQKFNHAKAWFKSYRKQHKWWLLQRQLKKHNLWIHQLGMKTLFSIKNSKENPFEVAKQDASTIKALVQAYQEAEYHWSQKICNNFDSKLLRQEGFMEESLDFCRKGYISIQDLTRFVNLELKTFYHIRQLEIIFMRFKSGEYLQFFDILQAISKIGK